jgi:MOSC domain-containing protein YiiM
VTPPHRALRLWTRSAPGRPPQERPSIDLVEGKGVHGDHTFGRMRHVTIIFDDDWRAAAATLAREVDPVGRRANVLVSGGDGARLVGSTIRLGGARIEVKGVTQPCPVMEKAAPGMEAALKPAGRGGVWGRVLAGGTVRPGDELVVEPS